MRMSNGLCPFATYLPSPNRTSGRSGATVGAVVLHVMQGDYDESIKWLRSSASKASSHFAIAKDGRIAQLVPIGNTAWTNGATYYATDPKSKTIRWTAPGWYNPRGVRIDPVWPGMVPGTNPNSQTITIEHEGKSGEPWTAAMRGACVRLLVWIAQQTGLVYVPRQTLIGHGEIDNVDRKYCPGPTVDFAGLAAAANGASATQPPPAAPAAYTSNSPLIAPTDPEAARQCIAYILRRPHGEYTEADIRDVIVPAYARTCAAAGIDLRLAVAQMVHETGCLTSWWAARPRRNPAGIGVTGASRRSQPAAGAWAKRGREWYEGVSFATWDAHAIPAHVGRLLAYALCDDQATPPQRALIAQALAVRVLPADKRGVAPTLRGLGGTWAVPGHGYGQKLADIANAIRQVRP